MRLAERHSKLRRVLRRGRSLLLGTVQRTEAARAGRLEQWGVLDALRQIAASLSFEVDLDFPAGRIQIFRQVTRCRGARC